MIGTESTAIAAADYADHNQGQDFEDWALPYGWSVLGEGAYRVALLAPDGVVYKVQHDSESGLWDENREEWENFQLYAEKVWEKTAGKARLAKCDYFSDSNVIAMEYVPKHEDSAIYDWDKDRYVYKRNAMRLIATIKKFTEITDLHSMNCWFNNGILTVVDMNV